MITKLKITFNTNFDFQNTVSSLAWFLFLFNVQKLTKTRKIKEVERRTRHTLYSLESY